MNTSGIHGNFKFYSIMPSNESIYGSEGVRIDFHFLRSSLCQFVHFGPLLSTATVLAIRGIFPNVLHPPERSCPLRILIIVGGIFFILMGYSDILVQLTI